MGTDKALLEVDGRAMAARVADALGAAGCAPVVCVGGDAPGLAALGLATVVDDAPGEGPAGGVITALRTFELSSRLVVVAACDLPQLDAATVRLLIDALADESVDVAVARTDRQQYSLTCWRTSTLPTLRQQWLAGDRSLRALVAAMDSIEVPVPAHTMRNVNAPSGLCSEHGPRA